MLQPGSGAAWTGGSHTGPTKPEASPGPWEGGWPVAAGQPSESTLKDSAEHERAREVIGLVSLHTVAKETKPA